MTFFVLRRELLYKPIVLCKKLTLSLDHIFGFGNDIFFSYNLLEFVKMASMWTPIVFLVRA